MASFSSYQGAPVTSTPIPSNTPDHGYSESGSYSPSTKIFTPISSPLSSSSTSMVEGTDLSETPHEFKANRGRRKKVIVTAAVTTLSSAATSNLDSTLSKLPSAPATSTNDTKRQEIIEGNGNGIAATADFANAQSSHPLLPPSELPKNERPIRKLKRSTKDQQGLTEMVARIKAEESRGALQSPALRRPILPRETFTAQGQKADASTNRESSMPGSTQNPHTNPFGFSTVPDTKPFGVPNVPSTNHSGLPTMPNTNPFGLPSVLITNPFGLPNNPNTNPFGLPANLNENPHGLPNRPNTSQFSPTTSVTQSLGDNNSSSWNSISQTANFQAGMHSGKPTNSKPTYLSDLTKGDAVKAASSVYGLGDGGDSGAKSEDSKMNGTIDESHKFPNDTPTAIGADVRSQNVMESFGLERSEEQLYDPAWATSGTSNTQTISADTTSMTSSPNMQGGSMSTESKQVQASVPQQLSPAIIPRINGSTSPSTVATDGARGTPPSSLSNKFSAGKFGPIPDADLHVPKSLVMPHSSSTAGVDPLSFDFGSGSGSATKTFTVSASSTGNNVANAGQSIPKAQDHSLGSGSHYWNLARASLPSQDHVPDLGQIGATQIESSAPKTQSPYGRALKTSNPIASPSQVVPSEIAAPVAAINAKLPTAPAATFTATSGNGNIFAAHDFANFNAGGGMSGSTSNVTQSTAAELGSQAVTHQARVHGGDNLAIPRASVPLSVDSSMDLDFGGAAPAQGEPSGGAHGPFAVSGGGFNSSVPADSATASMSNSSDTLFSGLNSKTGDQSFHFGNQHPLPSFSSLNASTLFGGPVRPAGEDDMVDSDMEDEEMLLPTALNRQRARAAAAGFPSSAPLADQSTFQMSAQTDLTSHDEEMLDAVQDDTRPSEFVTVAQPVQSIFDVTTIPTMIQKNDLPQGSGTGEDKMDGVIPTQYPMNVQDAVLTSAGTVPCVDNSTSSMQQSQNIATETPAFGQGLRFVEQKLPLATVLPSIQEILPSQETIIERGTTSQTPGGSGAEIVAVHLQNNKKGKDELLATWYSSPKGVRASETTVATPIALGEHDSVSAIVVPEMLSLDQLLTPTGQELNPKSVTTSLVAKDAPVFQFLPSSDTLDRPESVPVDAEKSDMVQAGFQLLASAVDTGMHSVAAVAVPIDDNPINRDIPVLVTAQAPSTKTGAGGKKKRKPKSAGSKPAQKPKPIESNPIEEPMPTSSKAFENSKQTKPALVEKPKPSKSKVVESVALDNNTTTTTTAARRDNHTTRVSSDSLKQIVPPRHPGIDRTEHLEKRCQVAISSTNMHHYYPDIRSYPFNYIEHSVEFINNIKKWKEIWVDSLENHKQTAKDWQEEKSRIEAENKLLVSRANEFDEMRKQKEQAERAALSMTLERDATAKARNNHKNEVDDLEIRLGQQECETLVFKYEAEFHKAKLMLEREDFEEEKQAIREGNATAIKNLEKISLDEMNAQDEYHDGKKAQLQNAISALKGEAETVQSKHQAEMAAKKEELASIQTQHQEKVEAMENEAVAVQARHQEEITALTKKYKTKVRALVSRAFSQPKLERIKNQRRRNRNTTKKPTRAGVISTATQQIPSKILESITLPAIVVTLSPKEDDLVSQHGVSGTLPEAGNTTGCANSLIAEDIIDDHMRKLARQEHIDGFTRRPEVFVPVQDEVELNSESHNTDDTTKHQDIDHPVGNNNQSSNEPSNADPTAEIAENAKGSATEDTTPANDPTNLQGETTVGLFVVLGRVIRQIWNISLKILIGMLLLYPIYQDLIQQQSSISPESQTATVDFLKDTCPSWPPALPGTLCFDSEAPPEVYCEVNCIGDPEPWRLEEWFTVETTLGLAMFGLFAEIVRVVALYNEWI